MAELADALASGASASNGVQVQPLFRAPTNGGIMVKIDFHGKYDTLKFADFLSKTSEAFAQIKDDRMSGWLDLPNTMQDTTRIKEIASRIQNNSKYLVCIGIGGSYVGHRAVIEALGNKSGTKVLFAGNSFSTFETNKILDEIGDADFSVNVISKSGTTLEPAIAFRYFKQKLIAKYGEEEALRRIYVTTDSTEGVLRKGIETYHYESFIIPDSVGGRYSVLVAGLLPIAVAGLDIDKLLEGARSEMQNEDIFKYAAFRASLGTSGYDTEVLTTFRPELRYFGVWWKQLFGESEGKNNQGIFPASMIGSTDLHSLGQYLQQGRRNIFETFLNFENPRKDLQEITVPEFPPDIDKLNYLAGKTLYEVNDIAYAATITAHSQTIPLSEIKIPELDEYNLGALFYFFELACAISATLQMVDPFDQPGVEAYKREMFRLLGRP